MNTTTRGKKDITGAMMRDGYEALDVDEARLKELGAGGLTIPVKITCENHEGPRKVAVEDDALGDDVREGLA